MKIFRHYGDVPAASRGAVVAIGNFDGVHRGHQALLARAKEMASARGAPLGVLAFEPHPQEFFRPQTESFRLTPFRTKARLLAECGVDILYALPFDAAMAGKSAEDFIRDVLVDSLGVKAVVVGADFKFGKGRTGDSALLLQCAERYGFQVEIFAPVIGQGSDKISSSDIRAALKAGEPERAAKLLDHFWSIEGRVEHGDRRGRDLGYPTANMRMDGYVRPAFGVYAVRAAVMDEGRSVRWHRGVANLGIRPMFEIPVPLLETYLFDFTGDLYDRHLAVELVSYLRPEETFESLEALKAQMAKDCEAARLALDRALGRC